MVFKSFAVDVKMKRLTNMKIKSKKSIVVRNGQTFVEWLVVIGIIAIIFATIFAGAFGWCSKHVWGNKQIVDFNHQRFNVAYVLGDAGKWERINIKAWKDWDKSDSIQIIKMDGNAIYTHLMNVKLCKEN